jgi:hypothetical protein
LAFPPKVLTYIHYGTPALIKVGTIRATNI